jgi:hypothetical protein
MVGYALDATGFYYVSAGDPADDAGSPLSITRVSLDGTAVTTLGSSSEVVSPIALGGTNVFLDDQSVDLVNEEGLWSVPKRRGTVTHVRSDVQALLSLSGSPTAARSGTEFFAVEPSYGLVRFTLDPNVPPDPIAIASSAWTNIAAGTIVGDDQGVYAFFSTGGLVTDPLVLASVTGGPKQTLACLQTGGSWAVQIVALDATYVYFGVLGADNTEIDIVRVHR